MLEPDEHNAGSVARIILLCLRLRLKAQWMYCNSLYSQARRTQALGGSYTSVEARLGIEPTYKGFADFG
jgi:hypothetical protein